MSKYTRNIIPGVTFDKTGANREKQWGADCLREETRGEKRWMEEEAAWRNGEAVGYEMGINLKAWPAGEGRTGWGPRRYWSPCDILLFLFLQVLVKVWFPGCADLNSQLCSYPMCALGLHIQPHSPLDPKMGKAAASHPAVQERKNPQVWKTSRCVFPLTKLSKVFKIILVDNIGQ